MLDNVQAPKKTASNMLSEWKIFEKIENQKEHFHFYALNKTENYVCCFS